MVQDHFEVVEEKEKSGAVVLKNVFGPPTMVAAVVDFKVWGCKSSCKTRVDMRIYMRMRSDQIRASNSTKKFKINRRRGRRGRGSCSSLRNDISRETDRESAHK